MMTIEEAINHAREVAEKVESEMFRLKNGERVPLHLRNKSKIKQEYLSFMTERMHLQE